MVASDAITFITKIYTTSLTFVTVVHWEATCSVSSSVSIVTVNVMWRISDTLITDVWG